MATHLIIIVAIFAAVIMCLIISYSMGKEKGADETRMRIARTVASSPLQGELWIIEAKLALTQAAIKEKLSLWGDRISLSPK